MGIRLSDLDRELRFWIGHELENYLLLDDELNRQELLVEILCRYEYRNDAERHLKPNGRIGFRATKWFKQRMHEGEYDDE